METIKNTIKEIRDRGQKFINKYLKQNGKNNFSGTQLAFA
jgi:hypothetical protein